MSGCVAQSRPGASLRGRRPVSCVHARIRECRGGERTRRRGAPARRPATIVHTLVENGAVSERFARANGLSLHIQARGLRLLFDLGPDDTFARNAEAFGLSIPDVDLLVVSHGHRDHGGGLPLFLELNAKAPVYLARGAFDPHYWRRRLRMVDVGLPPLASPRLRFFDGEAEPAPGLRLLVAKGRKGFAPPANRQSYARVGGRLGRDDFSHEALLSVEEEGRLYVFTGCSHSGVTNMMEEARSRSGGLPIEAVVGGMHLFHSPLAPLRFARDMRRLAADLAAYEGTRYYTGHCSVEDGCVRLEKRLGNRLGRIASGGVLEL